MANVSKDDIINKKIEKDKPGKILCKFGKKQKKA